SRATLARQSRAWVRCPPFAPSWTSCGAESNRRQGAMPAPRSAVVIAMVSSVLACSAYFRVTGLDRMPYWHDEALTTLWLSGHGADDLTRWVSDRGIIRLEQLAPFRHAGRYRAMIRALASNHPLHTPLYPSLAWLWVWTFGDSVVAMRALSVLCGVVMIPLV